MNPETKEKFISIGKGALIAAAGAVATYLAQMSTQTDFGLWTPIATAAMAVVVNALRKFATQV